jgi:hypothetical protein
VLKYGGARNLLVACFRGVIDCTTIFKTTYAAPEAFSLLRLACSDQAPREHDHVYLQGAQKLVKLIYCDGQLSLMLNAGIRYACEIKHVLSHEWIVRLALGGRRLGRELASGDLSNTHSTAALTADRIYRLDLVTTELL